MLATSRFVGEGFQSGQEIESFVLEKKIGQGSFAQVWRGRHISSGVFVAVKIVQKQSLNTPTLRTRFQREIALMKQFDHPFIAEFFQFIETDLSYMLVMEYAENGSLLEYVTRNGPLSEDQARRYFAQLISVLEYLHCEQKVAHRDLKCENILLDRYNNIRVIDFGLSNQFSDECPELTSACGSPAYAAPEMVMGRPYTQDADIWSSGIFLFAIVTAKLPFFDDNIQRLFQKIVHQQVTYPTFLSSQLIDLLERLLCKEPENRISLAMIKSHTWFSQTEYVALLEQSKPKLMVNGSAAQLVIQRDVIEQITGLGIDCHELPHSLLVGEFTPLTALYRIYQRQKTTEKMKDLMQRVAETAQKKLPAARVAQPLMIKPLPGAPPAKLPFPGVQARVMTAVGPTSAGRRASRPNVAIRRNTLPDPDRVTPFEA
jgi:serine/threonine protein kinase